jgi:hypothetical protein
LFLFLEIEQIKGEMDLKSWENNIEESKRPTKEENNAFLDVLLAVDLEMEEIDIGDIHAFIGKFKIERRKENMKKRRERMKNSILQINHVNLLLDY